MRRRTFLVLAIATVLLVTTNVPAEALTQSRVWIAGKTLKIRDASTGSVPEGDFANGIALKAKRDEGVVYVMDYNGSVVVGPGCTAGPFVEDVSAGRPEDVWVPQWDTYQAKCPLAGLKKIDINSGVGDDSVQVILSPIEVKIVGGEGHDDLQYWSCDPPNVVPYFAKSTISGGLGDDYLVGGRGSDKITGARGWDYVEGTCGADRLSGGSNEDFIISNDNMWCDQDCGPDRDVVSCGDSFDGVIADTQDVYSPRQCENVDVF